MHQLLYALRRARNRCGSEVLDVVKRLNRLSKTHGKISAVSSSTNTDECDKFAHAHQVNTTPEYRDLGIWTVVVLFMNVCENPN